MLFKVLIQVDRLKVDFCGQLLVSAILVDKELDIGFRTDELGLFLHDFGLTHDFRAERAHVLHHLLEVILHKVDA